MYASWVCIYIYIYIAAEQLKIKGFGEWGRKSKAEKEGEENQRRKNIQNDKKIGSQWYNDTFLMHTHTYKPKHTPSDTHPNELIHGNTHIFSYSNLT